MAKKFLHEDKEFPDLIQITANELNIDPYLVEKDYWIMHCLYGLAQQGFDFELKGGTSLSKGYQVIQRFSEDIDLRITPPKDVKTGKNQTSPAQIESRRRFFDGLAKEIKIPGTIASRDTAFDDAKLRSAGISLSYKSKFSPLKGVKPTVLLEAGFDDTTPNIPITISSWALERARTVSLDKWIDNRAIDVKCYVPEYTFVEKLQAIATKFRKLSTEGLIEKNFLRHYYDVYCLLEVERVTQFIGTPAYQKRKLERFRAADKPLELSSNPAFNVQDRALKKMLTEAYASSAALYYAGQPSFTKIMKRIASVRAQL